jgi:hypothetical protein
MVGAVFALMRADTVSGAIDATAAWTDWPGAIELHRHRHRQAATGTGEKRRRGLIAGHLTYHQENLAAPTLDPDSRNLRAKLGRKTNPEGRILAQIAL